MRATHRVYRSARYPSRVEVPVVIARDDEEPGPRVAVRSPSAWSSPHPRAARSQDPDLNLPPGIFVDTADGPPEVGVYGARDRPGGPGVEAGSLDDAVPVTGVVRVICNLPFWQVRSVWMTTASIVRDGRAKRRNLSIRTARLKSPATFVQVVPSEDGAELTRLFQEVGATPENPPFVFVTLTSAGRVRDYAIALAID